MGKDLEDVASQIGEAFRKAREQMGVSQEAAAMAIGVSPKTVSRWELGKNPPSGDTLITAAAFYGVDLATILPTMKGDIRVPRGTVMSSQRVGDRFGVYMTDAIREKLEVFKREMLRAGADDAEVDYIEETFRRPETARLAHHDSDGKDLSRKQVEEQYDALIDGIRQIITRRIERRRKASKGK